MTKVELLKRVKAATGPSRELDAEIARALGWREHEFLCQNINGASERVTVWLPPDADDAWVAEIEDEMRQEAAVNHWRYNSDPPRLTSSLDACAALQERLLPGWASGVTVAENRPAYAFLSQPEDQSDTDWPHTVEANGSTETLARLAAILSALIATESE
jgi:hypothetical protein